MQGMRAKIYRIDDVLPSMSRIVEKNEGQFRQVWLQGSCEQYIQLAIGSDEHLGVEI